MWFVILLGVFSSVIAKGYNLSTDFSNLYVPYLVECPNTGLIRVANGKYVAARRKISYLDFLDIAKRLQLPIPKDHEAPTIGITISGGGYRAMLLGAGVLSALDSRTPNSKKFLGGIYQCTDYLAGNSGGLWLVANNLLNNGVPIWQAIGLLEMKNSLIEGFPEDKVGQLKLTFDSAELGQVTVPTHEERNPAVANVSVNLSEPLSETGVAQNERDGLSELKKESNGRRTSNELKNESISRETLVELKNRFVSTLLRTFFTKDPSQKNFTEVESEKKSFKITNSLNSSRQTLNFYRNLNIEVRAKREAGFKVSMVDYWGRAISRRIFPLPQRKNGKTLLSVRELSSIVKFAQPFPIFGSVEREPSVLESSVDSHLFEFTPYEFGSWDSNLNSFVDTKYLGTNLINGVPQDSCIAGYDNLSLVIGASSSLFNTFFHYVYLVLVDIQEQTSELLSSLLNLFGLSPNFASAVGHPDYALFAPNPFRGLVSELGRSIGNSENLYLADGGDDGQNIPFHPMLVPGRKLDLVIAFDATSDWDNYPNGTSLRKTAERYHSNVSSLAIPIFQEKGKFRRIFPRIPTENEFVTLSLRKRPIFFGCEISDFPLVDPGNSSNERENSESRTKFKKYDSFVPPLIVYLSNHNHSFPSNTSTFRTTYTELEIAGMVTNGFNIATYSNNTEYSKCVGCALMKRKADSGKVTQPEFCKRCFRDYCWNA